MASSEDMKIYELTVRAFGGIEKLNLRFSGTLDVVKERYLTEISCALQTVFQSKALCIPAHLIKEDSEIEARVLLAGKEYHVRAIPAKEKDAFFLHAENAACEDCTQEYLEFSTHCAAQDAAELFDGSEQSGAGRLLDCEWESMYFGKTFVQSEGRSTLRAFRAYLTAFIRNFRPERLREGKEYEIVLEESGRYTVRHAQLGSRVALSATEERIFRYLCFLRTAEFWHGFEKIRELNTVKKPFLLWNFVEMLDESVDARALLQRAAALGRQVILLTIPSEKKLKSAVTGGEKTENRREKVMQRFSAAFQKSYKEAAQQYEIRDWSMAPPNLLVRGAFSERASEIRDVIRTLGEGIMFRVVEFDELDFDVARVQGRELYRELNEEMLPTVFFISNYGACDMARDFLYSLARSRLYPITNLWVPTIAENLLFTVALEGDPAQIPAVSTYEQTAFRLVDLSEGKVKREK